MNRPLVLTISVSIVHYSYMSKPSMHSFLIQGQPSLRGSLPVNGAKNFALKVLPAALLMPGQVTITNVPHIQDVITLEKIIQSLGVQIETRKRTRQLTIPKNLKTDLPIDLAPKIRASILLIGPLLTRFGTVRLPQPGGCSLGRRPIDLFIQAFEAMGATVRKVNEAYIFSAQRLTGARIVFPRISVTGTETVIMAATLAQGTTTIANAAMEPEIIALAEWLNRCGAKITDAGTAEVKIQGVKKLTPQPVDIIPDRIEAGSFVILAAATRSKLTITHCVPEHLETCIQVLRTMGVQIETTASTIKLVKFPKKFKAVDIFTHEYPGFPTDIQAPMTVLLTQAAGESRVTECLFEGRLLFTDKLNKMGAKITVSGEHTAFVHGSTPLVGRRLESPDIRAGLAFVIAALVAKGETQIDNVYQIDRGYEELEHRLRAVGVSIQRISYERA